MKIITNLLQYKVGCVSWVPRLTSQTNEQIGLSNTP